MLAHLPGQQISARNVELLLLGVATQLDDLHSVEQSRVNRPELVGRGDEQNLRQVHRHFEVVVPERVVLRRVEYSRGGGRIALEAGGTLSISSSMNTGFMAPACLSAWTMRPGIDPM